MFYNCLNFYCLVWFVIFLNDFVVEKFDWIGDLLKKLFFVNYYCFKMYYFLKKEGNEFFKNL